MFSFNKLPLILTTAVTAFTLQSTHAQTDTFCDYLQGDGNFTFLFEALNSTGLCDDLADLPEDPGATLFAPTDDAFNAVNASQPEVLECLGNNTDQLKDLLLYHVIKGSFKSDDLGGVEEPYGLIETLNGETIFVTDDGSLKVNDIAVVEPFNKTVENGFIHAIAGVLVPPDLKCAKPTFCDYLQGDGNFTFLFEALNSTGLCDALDNLDKGTLFAPTNEAFDALNASQPEVVECLSNETNADALTDILLFHVTKSELDSKTLTSVDPGTTFETLLDGETISVNSTDGKLIINDNSTVEEPFDVDIVNGILHTIDMVLVPEDADFDKICNGTKSSKSAKSSSSKSASKSKAGKRDKMANAMALPSRGGGRIYSRDSREEEDDITNLIEDEGLSMLFERRTLN